MYPPRYFVGWLVLANGIRISRVDFDNALMVPMTLRRALIFPGTWDSAFYATRTGLCGVVREIQYAISALDAKTLRPQIEKFKHPFKTNVNLYRDNDHLVIAMPRGDRSPLFITEPLHNVLDHAQGSRVPVIQFIA